MQAFSLYDHFILLLLDIDTHGTETSDGGEAVRSAQEMSDSCGAFGKGSEHDSPVRNGFVSGNMDHALKCCWLFNNHNSV